MLKETDLPSETEWESYFRAKHILLKIGLRAGMVLADLGCGYGTFSIPGAKIVGNTGQVFAIDIDKRMIERVKGRANEMGITNIRTITSSLLSNKNSWLPKGSVDIALLANVIHGTKTRVKLLKHIKPMIRAKGLVAVINWKCEKTPRGPPMRMRPSEEQMLKYLLEAGYDKRRILDLPPYHYAAMGNLSRNR